MDFLKALEEKVLIFDGAMGSSIHQYDLSLDDYEGCENCSGYFAGNTARCYCRNSRVISQSRL